jgi:hypothetical protein
VSKPSFLTVAGGVLAAAALVASGSAAASGASARGQHASSTATAFLSSLHAISTIGSTVPANGDVNPYGLAVVGSSVGSLKAGDYLVSNFNAKSNNQGTGTTIVQMTPGGKRSVLATVSAKTLPGPCPGGVGLTTALSIPPGGYVVVGRLPTTNGMSATAQYGCLIVLNSSGKPVQTIAGNNIQGPWDMTSVTQGSTTTLFVSNVLNGGAKAGLTTIDNIPWRDDTGGHLNQPLGLILAPNGDILTTNAGDGNIVETTPTGHQIATAAGDSKTGAGSLFGLAIAPGGKGLLYVDDGFNTLRLLH